MLKEVVHPLKIINAKYHLRFRCPKCPSKKRNSRDILNRGDCYWYINWKKGNYDFPSYYFYKFHNRK